MLLDLLFIFPLIVFSALGFRDGLVRKAVAIVVAIIGMFVAQFLMKDFGDLLVKQLSASPSSAPIQAYLMIFFMIFVLQSLLYRIVAKNYKIGGIADRIIGSALGLAQGVLVISIVLVAFSLQGWPDRKTARDSRLYRSIVSVAPMISDFTTTAIPEAKESLEKLTKPDRSPADTLRRQPR